MGRIENGSRLNLSMGVHTSFLNFVSILTIQYGYDPRILGDGSKPTGVLSRVGDTTKQKLMAFSSSIYTGQGIKECLEYFQEDLIETVKRNMILRYC
jgi:hypothetical protein